MSAIQTATMCCSSLCCCHFQATGHTLTSLLPATVALARSSCGRQAYAMLAFQVFPITPIAASKPLPTFWTAPLNTRTSAVIGESSARGTCNGWQQVSLELHFFLCPRASVCPHEVTPPFFRRQRNRALRDASRRRRKYCCTVVGELEERFKDVRAVLPSKFIWFRRRVHIPLFQEYEGNQWHSRPVFPNLFLASAPFPDKQISIAPLPCLTHISTQFFRIVYLGCLKMIKTRMSAKIHFTIELNLVN